MKIYLCCPVRGISDQYRKGIEAQVKALEEEGHKVYYPARDTKQEDKTGLRICLNNKSAIEQADMVYVIWDGKSQGSLFDLGIAFALVKPIRVVTGYMPPMTNGKSFQNMIYDWEEHYPPF